MDTNQSNLSPDLGTGEKKLGSYIWGLVGCSILTLISFWAVISGQFAKWEIIVLIYVSAIIQFLIQLIYFLRLNVQTKQGEYNVIALVFTMVILTSIIAGSLWIMWNLNYYMEH